MLTSFFYYNDYDSMEEESRNMLRKSMAAFGGIAPTYHIELLDRPTIYWDFHSLLLGTQMMFSFMMLYRPKPLRMCKQCQKVSLINRDNSAFCREGGKHQTNVDRNGGKNKAEDGDNNA